MTYSTDCFVFPLFRYCNQFQPRIWTYWLLKDNIENNHKLSTQFWVKIWIYWVLNLEYSISTTFLWAIEYSINPILSEHYHITWIIYQYLLPFHHNSPSIHYMHQHNIDPKEIKSKLKYWMCIWPSFISFWSGNFNDLLVNFVYCGCLHQKIVRFVNIKWIR